MIHKPKRLEYYLKCPLAKLIDIVDNIDRYYYEDKTVKKNPDGSPKIKNSEIQYRTLYPSTGLLKTVQEAIKDRILSKIEFPLHIQGGVKKKSNITNAKRHQGKKYHFRTDLSEFYPSISYKMVYDMFIRNGFSPDVSRLLTQLTTYKGELPQGTPTSTHIANLVSLPIDFQLIEFCLTRGITYTRFVDDLSFSSANDFRETTHEIISIITSSGFSISHKKTFYKIGPTLTTGIWAKNNSLDARDDQKKRLANSNLTESQRAGLQNYIKRVKEA